MAAVLNQNVPETVEEKKNMLHQQHIAVWDVIGSCDIVGSSDSSIKNVEPNDLKKILNNAPVRRIYLNGSTAGKLYVKYLKGKIDIPEIILPSTSPANAGYCLERLCENWNMILKDLR
jgi:hypoxanthine-DNA glycosylase